MISMFDIIAQYGKKSQGEYAFCKTSSLPARCPVLGLGVVRREGGSLFFCLPSATNAPRQWKPQELFLPRKKNWRVRKLCWF